VIKIAVLLGVFALFGTSVVFSNFALASCAINDDWPDAPCFDVMPVNREEYREAWALYYDYKGSDWMEQKKAEMLDAKDDGMLAEWMNGGSQNHNVFSYYQSRGEISFPPEYDRPFFEDDFRYHLQFFTQGWMFFVTIGVSTGLIIRRRK
jgi:hypothetical protein